jgi:hypothetical protein
MSFFVTADGDPSIASSEAAVLQPILTSCSPIYQDERGEIQRHELCGSRVNLLYTKAGNRRSGDFHSYTQYDALLSGRAELLTLEGGKHVWCILTANDAIAIAPYVPHLFVFREDTVMMEWWDGPFSAWYYTPFRNMIKAIV